MRFTSFDLVFFTAGFLAPGCIWSAVLSMQLQRTALRTESRVPELLTLSCINYGLWSWALFCIFRTDFIGPKWGALPDSKQAFIVASLFVITFVSPIVLGLVTGKFQQNELIERFLRGLGFEPIGTIATAWDWQFSEEKPCRVIVTLKSGEKVYGLYGENSFAGDDPERRDLYLEASYRLLETGEWAPGEDTGGILIMRDQIETIKFRNVMENSQ